MARKRRKKSGATTVTVALDALEVARGHDGLLRGQPEPVVVLCVYLVGEAGAVCVLRHVERFVVGEAPPCVASPVGQAKLRHRSSEPGQPWLLVVAAALEQDRGDGVEEAFARLARPESLSLFTLDEVVPEPRLAHLAARSLVERGGVHEVHLLFGGEEAGRLARGDEWLGACAFAVAREGRPRALRFPFRAADGRNDWTLVVSLRA